MTTQEMNAALLAAAANGDTGQVQALLAQGADIRQRDRNGRTALWYAAESNSYETVQHLIRTGLSQSDEKDSLLHAAANFGTPDSLQAYLDAGCEVNVQEHGKTPLDTALWYHTEGTGYQRCIELLRLHGGKRRIELNAAD